MFLKERGRLVTWYVFVVYLHFVFDKVNLIVNNCVWKLRIYTDEKPTLLKRAPQLTGLMIESHMKENSICFQVSSEVFVDPTYFLTVFENSFFVEIQSLKL